MKRMNGAERKQVERLVRYIMVKAISDDYVGYILGYKDDWTDYTIMDEIIEDVMETSSWNEDGDYNEDDIRLAIGRVLMGRLGIEV